MRLNCFHCGDRDFSEFRFKGEYPERQAPDGATIRELADAIHLRANTAGLQSELWQHVYGCRAWLIVERDTRTHGVRSVRPARAEA